MTNLVERGESSFWSLNQKVTSPKKLAREIAAFANTEGGIILVGVGDKGELIGLETYLEESLKPTTDRARMCSARKHYLRTLSNWATGYSYCKCT